MYLSRLHISKFRVFDDITLYFKNGINILIGENNSGKTAIIDALRICLGCGKPDNFIYVQDGDLHVNPENPSEINTVIQFDLIFEFGDRQLKGNVSMISYHKIKTILTSKRYSCI